MNTFDYENIAAYNRQRATETIIEIRHEKHLLRSQVYHPGVFERTMLRVANWMIAAGKQIRQRYEIPGACAGLPSKHPAH
jgi:hypothetical protein